MKSAILKLPDGREFRIDAPDEETLQRKALEAKLRFEAEGLPELQFPGSTGRAMKVAAGFLTTPDVKARMDIVRKNFPEATIQPFDNNFIVDYEGTRSVMNKPGISTQDVADFGASAVKFLPAGKAAQLATRGFGRLGGILAGGVAAGGTSALEDVAAIPQGSEQGVIPGKLATDVALGGASELLAPVLSRSVRFLGNLVRRPEYVVDGVLTEAGEQAVRNSGYDPASVRAALREIVERQGQDALRQGDLIEATVRRTEAADLGVDLTRGQATQDFAQQSLEDTLRTSDVTSRAGQTLRAFDERQVADLGTAARRGAGTLDDAGESLLSGVRTQHQVARRAVDEAYAAARELDGSFTPESVVDMVGAINASVSDEIVTSGLHPAASKALGSLRILAKQINAPNTRFKPFSIRRMEMMRRQLRNLWNAGKNDDDKRLVAKMQRAFDQWMDEAIDTAAFSGDDQALEALKKARAENTRFRSQFTSQSKWDTPGKIVENLIEKDVTGREAVNYVFGAAALGRKQGVRATVDRLREILPDDQWNLVRETAWLRVIEKAYPGGVFSRARVLSAIDDALDGNGSAAMRAIFDPSEITEIRKLRRVIASTVTPADATGPSGTPRKIAQMMQQGAQMLGFGVAASSTNPMAVLLAFTPQGKRMLDFSRARSAVQGFQVPAREAAVIPALGIATGRELED